MDDLNILKQISLKGRVAYSIACFENTLFFLNYNTDDWKMVLEYLWRFTNIQYLDDWSGMIAEIIPENLLEFQTYAEHDFEHLDEKGFEYLYKLYQNIDKKIDDIMTAIYDIGTSYMYTIIQGYGQESLDRLNILINYMMENYIPLPDVDDFQSFSIKENKGMGSSFEGRTLSQILL